MSACQSSDPIPPSSIIDEISRMKNDNYVLLIVYLFLMGLFLYSLYYIVSDAIKIVADYVKMSKLQINATKGAKSSVDPNKDSGNQRDKTADNEFYPDVTDESTPQTAGFDQRKPRDYRPSGEKKFFQNVDTTYSEYNTQKTSYIAQVYQGRKNDDVINNNIEYSKYDDYEY